MRFILFLFLFISTDLRAQRSLNRESFMINVRPVLNGIINDFYQMINLFPEFPKSMVSIIEELDHLSREKEILKESCPRILNNRCKLTLESLRTKLLHLKQLSLNLISEGNLSSSLDLNSLSGYRLMTEFDVELEEVKGQLDNTSFLLKAGIPHRRETYLMIKELDELTTIVSLAVMEYIPLNYKEDFRHFFFNFIHPIQQQISKKNNYEFLNRNIYSLNFSINLLNQTLTKKKKTPEGMAPFLAVIHNRWNSIIRNYY
jgi:hypothetical protein